MGVKKDVRGSVEGVKGGLQRSKEEVKGSKKGLIKSARK